MAQNNNTTATPNFLDFLNAMAINPSFLIPEGIYNASYKEITPSQDPSVIFVGFTVTTEDDRKINAGVRVSLKPIQKKDGTTLEQTGLDLLVTAIRSQTDFRDDATNLEILQKAQNIKLVNKHYLDKNGNEQNGWSCPSKNALSAINEVADASDILE